MNQLGQDDSPDEHHHHHHSQDHDHGHGHDQARLRFKQPHFQPPKDTTPNFSALMCLLILMGVCSIGYFMTCAPPHMVASHPESHHPSSSKSKATQSDESIINLNTANARANALNPESRPALTTNVGGGDGDGDIDSDGDDISHNRLATGSSSISASSLFSASPDVEEAIEFAPIVAATSGKLYHMDELDPHHHSLSHSLSHNHSNSNSNSNSQKQKQEENQGMHGHGNGSNPATVAHGIGAHQGINQIIDSIHSNIDTIANLIINSSSVTSHHLKVCIYKSILFVDLICFFFFFFVG
jgi:hypothetical protein